LIGQNEVGVAQKVFVGWHDVLADVQPTFVAHYRVEYWKLISHPPPAKEFS